MKYGKSGEEIIGETFYRSASRSNVTFIDYSEVILRLNKIFYNFTHLNEKGANTFSEILARDINNLLNQESISPKPSS